MQFTIVAAAAMASLASASTVYVDNHCSFDLYLTSAYGGNNDGVHTLTAETQNAFNAPAIDDSRAQHALTISRNPDISSPLQSVFTIDNNNVIYYSLSTVYGDPLKAEGYELDSQGNGFDIVSPPNRSGDPDNEYSPSNPNGDHAVFSVTDNSDFIFSLCG